MSGIVVCVDPRAADEGAKVLEAGGNAFDAAVTGAFVQMVMCPFSCGVGGMVSAQLWKQDTGQRLVVDGLLRAGARVTDDMWAADCEGESEAGGSYSFADHRSEIGYRSICTPGTVAGLAEIHRLFGALPWRDLLMPAVNLARSGFYMPPAKALDLPPGIAPGGPDDQQRIGATAACARLYGRDAEARRAAGNIFQNLDYADTIERLAEHGGEDFYHGDLADAIAQDLERNGAFVTRQDFHDYQINICAPELAAYRGHIVYSNPLPGGGPLLLGALRILDALPIGELEHGSTKHLQYLASTFQLVNQDRIDFVGDPEHVGYELRRELTSPQRIDRQVQAVVAGVVGGQVPPPESPDTTHLSVMDAEGNIACITHSNGQHSGVVTPGLGFVYNNGMNRFDPRPGRVNSLAPGKARLHMMMPTLVFKDHKPVMVLGAPGGNAILSALVQTVSNVIDFGLSAVEAVSATRIHAEGATVWCEARIRSDVVAQLQAHGFSVVQSHLSHTPGIALSQLITVDAEGQMQGGSDPRGSSGVAYAR